MNINIERNYEPKKIINDGADYAKKIGVDKFYDHFVYRKPEEMQDAIKTAPGGALMFMLQTHIDASDETDRNLLNEVCKRLCGNETEYKKCFSIE